MDIPITDKQLKDMKSAGVPEKVIKDTCLFLIENNYELYNLAILGDDYRVMFRNRLTQKVEARLFPFYK